MTQLEIMSKYLLTLKSEEELARQKRIKCEEEIAVLVPGPERGSKTITLENGVKITVERGFNYKVDFDGIENNHKQTSVIRLKTTRELDVTMYEWMRENDLGVFNKISKYVVVTPKKTAITVKVK